MFRDASQPDIAQSVTWDSPTIQPQLSGTALGQYIQKGILEHIQSLDSHHQLWTRRAICISTSRVKQTLQEERANMYGLIFCGELYKVFEMATKLRIRATTLIRKIWNEHLLINAYRTGCPELLSKWQVWTTGPAKTWQEALEMTLMLHVLYNSLKLDTNSIIGVRELTHIMTILEEYVAIRKRIMYWANFRLDGNKLLMLWFEMLSRPQLEDLDIYHCRKCNFLVAQLNSRCPFCVWVPERYWSTNK